MRVSVISAATLLALGTQGILASVIPDVEHHEISAHEELEAEGFTIFEPSFTGDFGPNGVTMTLNGTIEEVIGQAEAMQPGFTKKINKLIADRHNDAAGIAAGDDSWRHRLVATKDCALDGWAKEYRILQGIDYLNSLPNGVVQLEKYGCSRVSCSYNSAIYLCWQPFAGAPDLYTPSWAYVADYAEGIVREWCPKDDGRVRGKAWYPKGMAVHVRKDNC
ncbi:uncharacterized protein DNG_04338 [Cephalotrichum gorgonifer]|uniref:Uncharacterized protein n=1 Tax=Cephalotrichum gorgonifer TaxID=2041049 RepID=A0AAE8SUG0_9PEZI|nr:uncharacterized protein DNG_04338 [Cephalotrichum gorgonifer]